MNERSDRHVYETRHPYMLAHVGLSDFPINERGLRDVRSSDGNEEISSIKASSGTFGGFRRVYMSGGPGGRSQRLDWI